MQDIAGNDMTWILKRPTSATDALVVNELIGMEAVSIDLSDEDDHAFGYRPYPLGAFGAMLDVAVNEWDKDHEGHKRPRFLEVGCGPGTKLVLADEVFHLQTYGFDVSPKYVQAASDLVGACGNTAGIWKQDVRAFDEWHNYDIISLNRPLRDYQDELRLELDVFGEMNIGSILILGNGLSTPDGWVKLATGVAAAVYKKVCKCYGVEDVLKIDETVAEATQYVLKCRVCDRSLTIS
jgi:SAM-dependent methyltransferase